MENKNLEQFIGISSVSKTLRNELIPTETTRANINKYGIMSQDKLRAVNREKLKNILDDYYRDVIDSTLRQGISADWGHLFDCIRNKIRLNSKEAKQELEKTQDTIRSQIYDKFAERTDFSAMFKGEIIEKYLPKYIEQNHEYEGKKDECIEVIKMFDGFTSSFGSFFESRKNIFSKAKISTSVGYRIVEENANIYFYNMRTYHRICEISDFATEELIKQIRKLIAEKKLGDIFSETNYEAVLTQEGIDKYNEIIGKVNLYMNLYCQKNKLKIGQFMMKRLKKQILCKGTSSFELPKQFENDGQVYSAINKFSEMITEHDDLNRLLKLVEHVKEFDMDRIYISSRYYNDVSKYVCKKWEVIKECIEKYYYDTLPGKGKAKDKKVEKATTDETFSSISRLNEIIHQYYVGENDTFVCNVEGYIFSLSEKIKLELNYKFDEKTNYSLIDNNEKIEEIKKMLDMYMDILHILKAFHIDDILDKDALFYSEIDDIYEDMKEIVPLYNHVRNYVTKKTYSQEKIRLYFNTSKLADGWSKSKEFDYNAILLMRDEKFYLGIINKDNKSKKEAKKVIAGHTEIRNDAFTKMNYYFIPDPKRMLPHVFLSGTGIRDYTPSQYIVNGYSSHIHLKSSNAFDIRFCHDLIDYFKACIQKHPEWHKFEFEFSETASYNDINDFYKEVEKQAYRIEWTYIYEEEMQKLEKDGQLFLFQIYNKDFAEGSTGKPNIHTMYLQNLFSKENLRDNVLMLNGNTQLFFRESSVKNVVNHPKDSVLVNRTYETMVDGKRLIQSIPEKEYMELYEYYKNGERGNLSQEASKYLSKVQCNKAKKDIVKDYRYTVDKFFIHMPIKINFRADVKADSNRVNEIAQRYIVGQNDLHIIGIDRGERNLIYVSVIDMHGNIKVQKSFNIVEQKLVAGTQRYYDYKVKLENREKERDEARKSWKTVGKIKELKEGYLSSVVHEIAQMVLKYNAIIAMEDLSYGFKRGRFKVERQVYQKFETMLISKLNYFADKSLDVDAPGGILRGYQLTYVPQKLQQLGKQCGIIFYVPAGYTSAIDPTTGFVNVFKKDGITTNEAKKKFLMKLDAIHYDIQRNMFKFSFDYNNFATHNVKLAQTKWDVYTNETRIKKIKKNGKWHCEEVDLTKDMKHLLDDFHIQYEDGQNILDDLSDTQSVTTLVNGIFDIFWLTIQLRNSKIEDDNYDRIISPVLNKSGEFFDSDKYRMGNDIQIPQLPKDADANGAYNIAMKGMYISKQIKEQWVEGKKLSDDCLRVNYANWFAFMQGERE